MLRPVHMRIPQDVYATFKENVSGETISGAVTRLMREELKDSLKQENREKRVIQIINNRRYDTKTAISILTMENPEGFNSTLYRKKTGELFIHFWSKEGPVSLPAVMSEKDSQFAYFFSRMNVPYSIAKGYEE